MNKNFYSYTLAFSLAVHTAAAASVMVIQHQLSDHARRMADIKARTQEPALMFQYVDLPASEPIEKQENKNARWISSADSKAKSMVKTDNLRTQQPDLAASAKLHASIAQTQGQQASKEAVEMMTAQHQPASKEKKHVEQPNKTSNDYALVKNDAEKASTLEAVETSQNRQDPSRGMQSERSFARPMQSGNSTIQSTASTLKGSSVSLDAETAFEASSTSVGRYLRQMKEGIWLKWFPYLAFKYPQDFEPADAVIGVKLDKQGNLLGTRVVQSLGNPLFAVFCQEAIRSSVPFGKPPADLFVLFGANEIELKFAFHYR